MRRDRIIDLRTLVTQERIGVFKTLSHAFGRNAVRLWKVTKEVFRLQIDERPLVIFLHEDHTTISLPRRVASVMVRDGAVVFVDVLIPDELSNEGLEDLAIVVKALTGEQGYHDVKNDVQYILTSPRYTEEGDLHGDVAARYR